MKYIMCQPSNNRFKWEVEVAVSDLINHGAADIVLLFLKENDSVVRYFEEKYDVAVHVYDDKRYDKAYIPSIKPYLFYRYLSEDPARESFDYFFMDSDMVFRQLPDYDRMPADSNNWYGSDCNNYMNLEYLKQCTNSETLIKGMTDIVGVDRQSIEDINNDSIGAQYVISRPTAEYFEKVYRDSIKLWQFVKDLDTSFQKWTVEMYATLWNMLYFGITPHVHEEMYFVFPTDDIDIYESVNILHNAGVTPGHNDLFKKSDYINKDPLTVNHDYVNKSKASYAYVQKMNTLKQGVNEMAVQVHGVLRNFTDLQDGDKVYLADEHYYIGDSDDDRTKELRGSNNKQGAPVIEALTKDELLKVAEDENIDVDKKAKVAELHKAVADHLNK
ncbi:hypothetical protein [Salinicoccus sp. HZC-1]|uniref:hypothetical protein n=1 Tax=Salinicoccus sp. HZC-1 TaxID=3385497 RepID=UPI00398A747A